MKETSDNCIFCQIADGTDRCSELHRDDLCISFLDLNPVNPGHALVCPLRHVESLTELNSDELAAILAVAQQIARTQIAELPDCSGVNLLLSDGEVAGQEVPHAHFHVIPRSKDDGFGWRRFGKAAAREELDRIAARLRGK